VHVTCELKVTSATKDLLELHSIIEFGYQSVVIVLSSGSAAINSTSNQISDNTLVAVGAVKSSGCTNSFNPVNMNKLATTRMKMVERITN